MPSDQTTQDIGSALKGVGEPFKTAVSTTVQHVRKMIAEQKESHSGLFDYNKAELGVFADGKIDVTRFASVLPKTGVLTPPMLAAIERSLSIMEEAEKELEDVHTVVVPEGAPVAQAIRDAFQRIGKAFGAARVVSMARSGDSANGSLDSLLEGVPFRNWTKSERQLAPPLVVEVSGSELNAASLAEFMDGAIKLILVPRGTCAPAPLVRLITPRTFVLQTPDPKDLAGLRKWSGPGIAMVAPEVACFLHDPEAGADLQLRLRVESVPSNPKQSLGGISVRQQLEELEQLRTLSGLSSVPQSPASKEGSADLPADPADKLAAWLLNQARDFSAD